jgi:hypothetical protein
MRDLSPQVLSEWDEFTTDHLKEKEQAAFHARKNAIIAVARGMSMASAAKKYGVNAKTLSETINKAVRVASDGRMHGWRAALPYKVRTAGKKTPVEFPKNAGPGAFRTFLTLAPSVCEFLESYTGRLPERNFPSKQFESFFSKYRSKVKELVPKDRYPANDPKCARRSVIDYIRQQRQGKPFVDEAFEIEDNVAAAQFPDVFALQLCDWTQYDGHPLDCDIYVEGEDGDGQSALQRITCTWLLVGYLALLRMCCSWKLCFGKNYNGTDFNEACANGLRSWTPRALVSPSMVYIAGSGIGTSEAIGFVACGAITSMDNAMAHRLNVNRQKLASQLRGVIHFGKSGVPETRGHLEAWNKRLEETTIRKLPGGYRPAGDVSEKESTNNYNSANYPSSPDALEDLMDVTISASNVGERECFQLRSPTQVLQTFHASGGWIFSTNSLDDQARELSQLQFFGVFRGSKKNKKQPYVRFQYAKYRSTAVKNRWDLIGQRFIARVDIHDARFIRLYDESGELFVVLRAIRPWSRTPHSLALRRLIHRNSKKGHFEVKGTSDAVEVYRNFLRSLFACSPDAATMMAQHRDAFDAIPDSKETKPPTEPSQARKARNVFVPLSGPVTLGKKGSLK